MKKAESRFGFLYKIILFIIITAALFEGVLRIYNKINPSFIFPSSSYNRFRGRPFAQDYDFRLNSGGFKDLEFNSEKETGIFRILAIGDSFCFGVVPYKYNFLTRLEEKLNQEGKRFEVINMGIPCIGVDSYLALLVNEGLDLSPDLAVCCFFIGNDFYEKREERPALYLFSLANYLMNIAPKYSGNLIYSGGEYDDSRPSLDFKDFLKTEQLRGWVFLKENGVFLKHLAYVKSFLKRMKDICGRRGIKFLAVLIPDEVQIDADLQMEVVKYFKNLRDSDFDFSLPNRLLSAELKKMNIDCLDLLDDFSRESQKKRLYKLNDTHWNIAGNELACGLIFDRIKDIR